MTPLSVPERAPRAPLRDAAALLGVLLLLAASAAAFVAPWLPPPPPSAVLERYAPVRDGAAWLTVTSGADGAAQSWTSGTQQLISTTRAFSTHLRQAQAEAVQAYYRAEGAEPPSIEETIARIEAARAQIVRQDERELGLTGLVTDSVTISLRGPGGDAVLGFYRAADDQDLMFEPALPALPADLAPGTAWQGAGTLAERLEYTFQGTVLERGAYSGAAGSFADCVRVETRLVLSAAGATLDDIRSRTWQCAGVGAVDSERQAADGSTLTRTVLVSATELRGGAQGELPAAAGRAGRPEAQELLPADAAGWELRRLGRLAPSTSASSTSFAPVWVPADPPLVLGAAYDGALTAYDAADPLGAVRWRFPIGGTFFGQPAYDGASGRVFVGGSDKRLYALDQRGVFLWSFAAEDNIVTRPAVAGGVVVFGSEDRQVYGLDAATGREVWRRPYPTGGPVVASPAVAGGVVAIGSDDGQVYGLDVATGEERWRAPFAAEDAVEAPLVAAGGRVYAASRDGQVYGLDAATGEQVWSGDAGEALRTAPAVASERVFVVGELGTLRALGLEDGRRLWVSADDSYVGPPVLLGAGSGQALAVARSDGVVELLDLDGRLLRSWDARAVRGPLDDEPGLAFGPTAGGGALWLGDDNGALLRLGPPPAGPAPLDMAWYHAGLVPPFDGESGSGMYYTAGAYEGRAVVLDSGRSVYLVDPADGSAERLGAYDVPEALRPFAPDPVVAGDRLLIGARGTLGALDLRDGRTAWTFTPEGGGLSYRPPAVAGDTALWLVGGRGDDGAGGALFALDLADGSVRWQAELDGFLAIGGVEVRGDTVYTSAPAAAFDLQTGRQLWRAALPGPELGGGTLSDDGGTLFVGLAVGAVGGVAALDTADGSVRWLAELDTSLSLLERLWLVDGALVVPAVDNQVLALDPADGRELWRAPSGPRWGAVTAAAGRIWLTNTDGRVLVLRAEDGAVEWFYGALDANLEITGLAAARPTELGGRMVLPVAGGVVAFEVGR